ncbi:hypothetical protein JAB4_059550 (plasmid) [Janthinobacterium sp. HH102]|nr:hypothetical protein JAB4_059550 [Janthinobacterium sp. HH102]
MNIVSYNIKIRYEMISFNFGTLDMHIFNPYKQPLGVSP